MVRPYFVVHMERESWSENERTMAGKTRAVCLLVLALALSGIIRALYGDSLASYKSA
jgi:hypothetical protein